MLQIDTIEAFLSLSFDECSLTNADLCECFDKVAKLYGYLGKVQDWINEVEAVGDEQLSLSSELTVLVESYCERLIELNEMVDEKKTELADLKKIQGNEAFKNEEYLQALGLYSETIDIDSTNPVYFTNRALCYQKMNKWEEALSDAQNAVELDGNMLKAYIIVIKCQIKLTHIKDLKDTILSIPTVHQNRPEVTEQKLIAASLAKDVGNNFLKQSDVDSAIGHYTIAIELDGENHIYFSNRSAAYQQNKSWSDAASDARKVLELNPKFAKGYLHLSRSLYQLQKYSEAGEVVLKAKSELGKTGELAAYESQLNEISSKITSGLSGKPTHHRSTSLPEVNAAAHAEALKTKGNSCYKDGEYQDAIRFYSQAIAALPSEGSFYGNRAACWMMLKEFKRTIDDCVEGIKLESRVGELDKLRLRHANALVQIGKVEAGVAMLEEVVNSTLSGSASADTSATASKKGPSHKIRKISVESDDEEDEEDSDDEEDSSDVENVTPLPATRTIKDIQPFEEQLKALKAAQSNMLMATKSLNNREFR